MEGLLELLYDRVNGRVSRSDLARIFNAMGGDTGGGGGGGGVALNRKKNSIEIYLILFYYFYYVEYIISLGRDCEVGLTTENYIWKKLMLMHQ